MCIVLVQCDFFCNMCIVTELFICLIFISVIDHGFSTFKKINKYFKNQNTSNTAHKLFQTGTIFISFSHNIPSHHQMEEESRQKARHFLQMPPYMKPWKTEMQEEDIISNDDLIDSYDKHESSYAFVDISPGIKLKVVCCCIVHYSF